MLWFKLLDVVMVKKKKKLSRIKNLSIRVEHPFNIDLIVWCYFKKYVFIYTSIHNIIIVSILLTSLPKLALQFFRIGCFLKRSWWHHNRVIVLKKRSRKFFVEHFDHLINLNVPNFHTWKNDNKLRYQIWFSVPKLLFSE